MLQNTKKKKNTKSIAEATADNQPQGTLTYWYLSAGAQTCHLPHTNYYAFRCGRKSYFPSCALPNERCALLPVLCVV
jgi:hypothetical protein